MDLATRVAHLGGWSIELPGLKVTWSAEVAAIHRTPPGHQPTVESGINFYAPEHRPLIAAAVQRCMEEGVPYDLQLQLLTYDGLRLWVRAMGLAVRDGAGRIVRVEGAFQDIDAQRRAEDLRRQLDERLALATAAANIGIWEVEADTQTIVWDERTFALYGRRAADGLQPQEVFDQAAAPPERERAWEWFNALFGGQDMPPLELELKWPDGTPHWIMAKGRLVQRPGDPMPAVLGVQWDITEQRVAQASLMASRAELSALALRLTEQERLTTRRLSQNLHDQLGQTLATLRLELDLAAEATDSMPTGNAAVHVARAAAMADVAIVNVRRTLVELRSALLVEAGLAAAIDNELRSPPLADAGLDLLLVTEPEGVTLRWPAEVEYAAFMVVREALGNVVRHASASLVRVLLSGGPQLLDVQVLDDGQGLSGDISGPQPGHLGLIGMHERALAIGAEFALRSGPVSGSHMTLRWRASQ